MQPETVRLKEIKPALYGYVREAQSILSSGEVPGECAVHDVRVLMKKSRATVRLLKSQIEKDIFMREYSAYRETGRLMRSWRENSVHRKMLKNLKKNYPEVFAELGGNQDIERIMKIQELSIESQANIKSELEKINELIKKSLYRLRFMPLENLDPNKLFDELESTYAAVGRCYMAARNSPKSRNLHEFRKRTKDFLYQLFFFRALNPKAIKSLEKRLDDMTQNLGKFNDLSVLVKMLGYKYNREEPQPGLDELVLLIRKEQDRYLSKVWPAAYKIFSPGQRLTNVLGFKMLVI